MKSLDKWLNAEKGRATRLAKTLCVNLSCLSQVRKGARKVPTDWMPVIEAFSGGELTIEGMVMQQAKGRLAERRKRKSGGAQ